MKRIYTTIATDCDQSTFAVVDLRKPPNGNGGVVSDKISISFMFNGQVITAVLDTGDILDVIGGDGYDIRD